MSENNKYESIKNKLLKLKALAERGFKGEADNAKKALERLCEQYGIKLDDIIENSEPQAFVFKIGRMKVDLDLFMQCYSRVTNKSRMTYIKNRDKIKLLMTPYEAAELKNLYNWHKGNFAEEKRRMEKTLLEAYCHKHNLHSSATSDGQQKDLKSMTREELMHLRDILTTASILDDSKHYQRMIE